LPRTAAAGDPAAAVLGPLRTLISVAFLAVFLWAAFSIKLGRLTFADHVDRIGQTKEAKELLDGARSRVRPALDEVKHRVLGEYVEAPTHLAAPVDPLGPVPRARPVRGLPAEPRETSTREATPAAAIEARASTPEAAKLPGRRKRP
jgi:hypothetical protein